MFHAIIDDPYIDAAAVDTCEYLKARRLSVIFSAFHKMLYTKEKQLMRKKFAENKQSLPVRQSTNTNHNFMSISQEMNLEVQSFEIVDHKAYNLRHI